MSDTEEKPKVEDLRRSKRKKFHLDIVAVLSRRSPDFRRATSRSDSPRSSFKSKSTNAARNSVKQAGDVPILEPMFPLDDDANLVKIESAEAEDLVNQSNIALENGVPFKKPKMDETNSVSSIENSTFPLIKQNAIKLEPKPKVIRCYKCLSSFKTNAGLGKHVKTCKKYTDSTRTSWPTQLPDLSNASEHNPMSRNCSSANNTPSNSSSSNAAMKKESDSESLEDSNELDMPVLTPECKPRRSKIIANVRPIQAASSPPAASIQEKRRLKRNRIPTSLQTPFDIKRALSLKLEIPPVPKIIVESPIEKNLDYFCSKCPFVTGDKNLLLLHKALHDDNGPRSYQCTFCSYGCFSPEALYYHLNLHSPALSPNTATNIRKHIVASKRNGIHNEVFTPTTSGVVQRLEQVQTQQQRLVSIIKRSGGDEHNHKRIKIRLPLPSTKFYTCKKCSFKSERKENLMFHEELHGSGLLYVCRHCDYSSNAKNVVGYHTRNHHFEASLTSHAASVANNILKKNAKETNHQRCNSVPLDVTLTTNSPPESYPVDNQSLADNAEPS